MSWRDHWAVRIPKPVLDLGEGHLAPRKVGVSDVRLFTDAMAMVVGGEKIVDLHSGHRRVGWDDFVRLVPDELAGIRIQVSYGPAPTPDTSPTLPYLLLRLNGPLRPATLRGFGVEEPDMRGLRERWEQLGEPRRPRPWIYAAGLALVLLAVLAPLVVLWVLGQLTLWLVPAVLLLLAVTWTVGLPIAREAAHTHLRERSGTDLDFRLIEAIRHTEAGKKLQRQGGIYGALIGAVVALVVGALSVYFASGK